MTKMYKMISKDLITYFSDMKQKNERNKCCCVFAENCIYSYWIIIVVVIITIILKSHWHVTLCQGNAMWGDTIYSVFVKYQEKYIPQFNIVTHLYLYIGKIKLKISYMQDSLISWQIIVIGWTETNIGILYWNSIKWGQYWFCNIYILQLKLCNTI